MIWGIRVTAGQEDLVATLLADKAKNRKEPLTLYSIIVPPGVRGYILVEAPDEVTVRRIIAGIPHIKGLVPGSMDASELDSLLAAKPLIEQLKPGTIVKVIAGPFKGAKAKIIRVDEQKEEVTIELLESAVKIPITIEAENVKVVEE